MKKAFILDVLRTVRKEHKRFFSFAVITMLGVMMFSGLQTACMDLRKSADSFFDEGHLQDLEIVSTLGLTEDDVTVLSALSETEAVEGLYSETVLASFPEDVNIDVQLETLSETGINTPYLVEGRLPEKEDEVAVTEKFLADAGIALGDSFDFSEDIEEDDAVIQNEDDQENDSASTFRYHRLTIVGVVIDVRDVNNPFGSTSYRSSQTDAVKGFVKKEACTNDVFTSIVITVKDAAPLFCFGSAYKDLTSACVDTLEKEIKSKREKTRYDSVYNDAKKEIDDAEAEANEKLRDAKTELDDAKKELADGQKEIDEQTEILNDNLRQLQNTKNNLISQQTELNVQKEGITAQLRELTSAPLPTEQKAPMLEALQAGLAEIENGLIMIQAGLTEVEAGLVRVDDGYATLASEQKKIDDGYIDYGEGLTEYRNEQKKAEEELADAREKLNDINRATWYISERQSLAGYNNISSDADSIEAIATAFPIVFLIVAILVSLTSITRMVDEDRGLIGTYKALGFNDHEIRVKYVFFVLFAGLAGSILGTMMGFLALPSFIFVIFRLMYLLPSYGYYFLPFYGLIGPVLFLAAIIISTVISARKTLRKTPASLMRPRTPKAGARVLLERITPIWKRLSFLNKVTARNIFRYKKRLLMTISGIAGCMALMLFGFAIKDSVQDLRYHQFDEVTLYDTMMIARDDDVKKIYAYIEEQKDTQSYLRAFISSVTISGANGEELNAPLIVIPDDVASAAAANTNSGSSTPDGQEEKKQNITSYINFHTLKNEPLSLAQEGVLVTCNAAEVLSFEAGDSLQIQLADLTEASVTVGAVCANYLSNYVFMTKTAYESYYEKEYKENGALILLSDTCRNPVAYNDDLKAISGVEASVSSQETINQAEQAFFLINFVVSIIIILSAALAFVVLFTLATTNISERERELATIKVLGFYDNEVHLYVDKETLILTGIGILCGVPLGYFFAQTISMILRLPSIYLAVSLHVPSYFYAAILSFLFAIIVNLVTDRVLNKIDPVEALKSVE